MRGDPCNEAPLLTGLFERDRRRLIQRSEGSHAQPDHVSALGVPDPAGLDDDTNRARHLSMSCRYCNAVILAFPAEKDRSLDFLRPRANLKR